MCCSLIYLEQKLHHPLPTNLQYTIILLHTIQMVNQRFPLIKMERYWQSLMCNSMCTLINFLVALLFQVRTSKLWFSNL